MQRPEVLVNSTAFNTFKNCFAKVTYNLWCCNLKPLYPGTVGEI